MGKGDRGTEPTVVLIVGSIDAERGGHTPKNIPTTASFWPIDVISTLVAAIFSPTLSPGAHLLDVRSSGSRV